MVFGNSVSASAQGGIGKSGKHVVDPFASSFTCMKFLSIVLEKKTELECGISEIRSRGPGNRLDSTAIATNLRVKER